MAWALAMLAPAIMAGLEVTWIDGGSSLPICHLAKTLKVPGVDSRVLLSRIEVHRPISTDQMEMMVAEMLPRVGTDRLVVVSDLLRLFCDPKVSKMPQAWEVFFRAVEGLRRLPRAVVLAVVDGSGAGQAHWVAELGCGASQVACLQEIGNGRTALVPFLGSVPQTPR